MNAIDLGILDYEKTWQLQRNCHTRVVKDPTHATIYFVEHPPVITLGKNADFTHLKTSKENLQAIGVELVVSDRGGDITGHFPGQIVVYPILNLAERNLTVRRYVEKLEQIMIDVLADFGIRASRDAINPGVWVGLNKIGAVGIRIKNRVSMHGLALNVNPDLNYFKLITPCGIVGRGVTSMQKELSSIRIDKKDVKATLMQKIMQAL